MRDHRDYRILDRILIIRHCGPIIRAGIHSQPVYSTVFSIARYVINVPAIVSITCANLSMFMVFLLARDLRNVVPPPWRPYNAIDDHMVQP